MAADARRPAGAPSCEKEDPEAEEGAGPHRSEDVAVEAVAREVDDAPAKMDERSRRTCDKPVARAFPVVVADGAVLGEVVVAVSAA